MSRALPSCPGNGGFLDCDAGLPILLGNVGVMPRDAVERCVSFPWVLALWVAFAAACGDDGAAASDGGSKPAMDASQDATVSDSSVDSGDASGGGGGFGGSPGLTGEYCVLRIAAQCDGPEDCPNDKCCGARFEPSNVSYTAIECSKVECDFQRVVPLCHAGQICSASGDLECRTSFLIPDDFIGVCALRTDAPRPPTGTAVAGMIDCGDEQCVVGAEQCCLREGFDVEKFQSVPYPSYCAPIGQPCDCDAVTRPPRDAGTGDDAGAD